MEPKVIVPETSNMQDFVAGSQPVKKRKSKKSKSKAAKDAKTDVSSAGISKNTDSKHLDAKTENSTKEDKRNSKLIPSSEITVTSSTVWNRNSNTATALFPEAQSSSVQIIDEDIELTKVLKDSILTAELEHFRLNDVSKLDWADELEDSECNSGRQVETFYDKDKGTEKVQKKSCDDNNNSDIKFVNFKEDSTKLDNYSRAQGYRYQQNFTGKETHTKEQQMFRHENNTGSFNQRQSSSVSEKSVCEQFQKINPYENRNRGQRDFDNRSNDDRREYRNRNSQTFNQRGRFENHQHRFDNHPQRHDNQPHRHDNQHQTYNNHQKSGVQQQYNNQPYRYDNLSQRHDNQRRRFENNRYGNNQRRDFPNRNQHQHYDSHKEELRDRDSNEFKDSKEDSNYESNKSNTPECQSPPEKEKEKEPETNPEFEPEVTPDVEPNKKDVKEISHSYNNQQKSGVQQQYNNQPYSYDNPCQRYDNQQRRFENNIHGNNQRRDFPNRNQHQHSNPHKEELRYRESNEFKDSKEDSNYELNKSNTPECQPPPEKEKEQEPERNSELKPEVTPDVKPDIEDVKEISYSNTSAAEESPSFTFMQESINEDQSCENAVENNYPKSETTSEQSEYPDTQTVASNPFIIRQVPIQVIHPSGIMYQTPEGVPIHNGIFPPQNMSAFNKQPGAMTYNMINPFVGSVLNPQHFQPQHTHEMLPESGCTAVPMPNFDMRLYHPNPFVHNHHAMPMTLPMPMSSCGHLPQMPMGMTYVHQYPVNCQQCPPNFCQSPRFPIHHLNCQSPIYPQFTNVMTPMGPVMPMTSVNQEQINPQLGQNPNFAKISHADKMGVNPATVIEKSANNLVNLCENLPSIRGSYPANCPPGFESNASPDVSQKKIICIKERDNLPKCRNISKEYTEENSTGSLKKTNCEEFSDERLNGILNTIFDKTKSENLEKEEVKVLFKCPESSIKLTKDSYQEQLLKSYSNSEKKPTRSKDIQAPKPGLRFGVGRGKKISHAD